MYQKITAIQATDFVTSITYEHFTFLRATDCKSYKMLFNYAKFYLVQLKFHKFS